VYIVVALNADDQGLTSYGDHAFLPFRKFASAFGPQIGKFADVMGFDVRLDAPGVKSDEFDVCPSTHFAFLPQQPYDRI
jgi:hypothetical protein